MYVATEKSNKANDAAQDKANIERHKALDTALAQIERQFGKGAVMKMSERQNTVIEVIPTGSIALDIALGIGGLPRGRVVEIYGPESSGKTTLTLHAIANAHQYLVVTPRVHQYQHQASLHTLNQMHALHR